MESLTPRPELENDQDPIRTSTAKNDFGVVSEKQPTIGGTAGAVAAIPPTKKITDSSPASFTSQYQNCIERPNACIWLVGQNKTGDKFGRWNGDQRLVSAPLI
jgi:hypothetical protein